MSLSTTHNSTSTLPAPLLKPKDVATALAVSQTTVYQLIRSGTLPAVLVSNGAGRRSTFRVSQKALAAFIEGHSTGAAA